MDDKTYKSLSKVLDEFEETQFYTAPIGENGYDMRKILDYNLSDQAQADREAIDAAVASGASREDELAKYTSEESFENWYQVFCVAVNAQ